MTGDPEKSVKQSDYVENAEARDGSDLSIDNDIGDLKILDKGGLNKDEVLTELPEAEAKRVLRKVDYRLVPLLTFLYLVAFIDRSNSMHNPFLDH